MNGAERMRSPYLVMGMPPEDYHKALVGGLFYVGDDPEEQQNTNATVGNAPAANVTNGNNAAQPAQPVLPQWLIEQRKRKQEAENQKNTIRSNAAAYHGLSQNPDIKQALLENAHITRNRAYARMNRPKVPAYGGGLYQFGKMPWQ